jgi:polyphenol oxidase
MNTIMVTAAPSGSALFPFYRSGIPVPGPRWGMSFRNAGSMRFRWNETNTNRDAFLSRISGPCKPVSIELIHSKLVSAVSQAGDTAGTQGDGIITINRNLMPVVTVADCMPVFFYDPVSGAFGSLHSGWKGTGIIESALQLAHKEFGTKAENCLVALGPHIRSCCYTIDETRARYFIENFTPECVTETADSAGHRSFRLSLERANLALLDRCGVPDENRVSAAACTSCCADDSGNYVFGSFRRETAAADPAVFAEARARSFTVQAAFCGWI